MGEDKALLPFGDFTSLAEYQYQRLAALFEHVYISTKENKFDFEVPLIKDNPTNSVSAPTAGFEAMFTTLKDERVFVLSVDTPFVSEKEIAKLIQEDSQNLDAVIAKTITGSHPLCGIYHRSLLPEFKKMLKEENHRLGKLLKNVKTVFVTFEDEAVFTNLNHQHEYKEALKRV